jgi:hypothetical protein
MEDFPEAMKLNPDTRVDVGIPSWHINAHGKNCRDNFSLGYLAGAGRTCGEEVETSWSHTNALAPSVREMGPMIIGVDGTFTRLWDSVCILVPWIPPHHCLIYFFLYRYLFP